MKIKFATVITLFLFLAACAPSRPAPTSEELAFQREMMQMMMSRASDGAPRQAVAAPTAAPAATITEYELSNQIASLPINSSGAWASIEPGPDGFTANGRQIVSPYGRVVAQSGDAQSGRVVYFIETGKNQMRVEMLQAFAPQQTVFLGTLSGNGHSWTFTSATGAHMAGDEPNPTSEGVLMARSKAGFHYKAGQGMESFTVPEGFHVASFQPGEIGATGYLLLERDEENSSNNPIAGLIGTTKSLGNMFGVVKVQDYIMLNIKSGNAIPLNLSLDDKETVQLTGCVKQNNYINECSGSYSYTSIWNSDGTRNGSHPYWRLKWLQSSVGPMLIAAEGTLRSKVVVVNLEQGTRYLAFSRTLGVNEFDVNRNANGKIKLEAKLGFSRKSIDDLDHWVSNAEPM